jgi:hypothetical protein
VIVFFEALFAVLVAADTWLTYRIIESGKGVEIGTVAKYYIDNKAVAITLSAVCVVALIGWLRLTGLWFFLIPADLYMGRLVYRNWRLLNG